MLNSLVIAATAAEIAPFLDLLRKPGNPLANRNDIDTLITGVGLTAATWAITRQLHIKKPLQVIQAGLAGSFDRGIPLGTVLAVKQDLVADQAVMEAGTFKSMVDLGLMDGNRYPYAKGWLVNKSELLKKSRLKKVKAISINEISTSPERIAAYRAAFDPALESMEGAALHYCCLMENVPFIQLRAVSNYVGERNKRKWFMQESINNLNNELVRLLT